MSEVPDKHARRLVKFGPWALAGGLILGVYLLSDVLTPFLMAALVAYIFDPWVTWIERKGRLSRGAVVGLLVFSLVVVLSVGVPFVVFKIVAEIRALLDTVPGWINDLTQQINQEKASRIPEWLRRGLYEVLQRGEVFLVGLARDGGQASGIDVKGAFSKLASGVFKGIGGATSLLFDGIIFVMVTAYMLKDFQKMTEFFKEIIPRHLAPGILENTVQIDVHLRSFFRGVLTVAFFLTVFYMVVLLLLGVPYSYLLGAFAGLANIIPVAGPLMAAVLTLVVTWTHSHAWQKLVAVAIMFFVAQTLDNTLLTPKVVGDKVGLNPVWIVFSIMVCGKFLGFFGVLLAVPIAATVKVIVSVLLTRYRSSPVYTGVVGR